jgi:hypothetical protein
MADSILQHPLVRDGRSQTDRLDLHALAPESVSLDDRQERQLLVYLNEFAKSVAYYDTDEKELLNFELDTPAEKKEKTYLLQDNWQSFFRSGSSVQVSLMGAFDLPNFETQFNQTKLNYKEGLVRGDQNFIFDFLFESALTVNAWYDALSSDVVLLDNKIVLNESPLRKIIGDLIVSNLKSTLAQLIATANLFVHKDDDNGYRVPDLSPIINNAFWEIDDTVMASRDNVLASLNHRPLEKERILRARLDEIFQVFAKSIHQIVESAAKQDILQATKTHEPHLALLYTFLRLMRHILDDLNQLPKRHLDFFYRDVLQLKEKKAIPDAAHIVFELPKNTAPQYKLDAKTLLKDGKDAKGQDIRFASDTEIVVNRAKIAELRTLYHRGNNFLFAHPKANSEDGFGKDFPDPTNAKWATLGSSSGELTSNSMVGLAIASPTLILEKGKREVSLLLTFNLETVTDIDKLLSNIFEIRLSGQKKWISPKNPLKYFVNGSNSIPSGFSVGTNQLLIQFDLGIKEPAIVAADPSVLGVNYGIPNAAVLQLIVKKELKNYNAAKDFKIEKVEITTTVSELQNVLIRTDEGDQDPTKPFMPFGAVPSVGSSFSIGSEEIFSKKITKFEVNYEWDKKPDFTTYYNGYTIGNRVAPVGDASFGRKLFVFKNSKFISETSGSVFDALTINSFPDATLSPTPSVSAAKDAVWQTGFVTVQLRNDFLHQFYADSLSVKALKTAQLIANPALGTPPFVSTSDIDKLKDNIDNLTIVTPSFDTETNAVANDIKSKSNIEVEKLKNIIDVPASIAKSDIDVVTGNISALAVTKPSFDLVTKSIVDEVKAKANDEVLKLKKRELSDVVINPPYTPVIKNLTVTYTAKVDSDDKDNIALFHIYPFDEGANFEKISIERIKDSSDATILITNPKPLIFNFKQEGALFIGLSNAVESSMQSLLFQLLESSASTFLPKAKIDWSYLNGNEWKDLVKGQYLLNDATNELIQSGIVDIILPPRTHAKDTTILPPQYYWLKVSCNSGLDAICKAIGVHIQAARATFQPTEKSDTSRLAEPLAAGSVSKLDVADPNIKSVAQLYPSFDGRPAESAPQYYRRVSEQLKHKGRAITIYDYEQLILEAFPEVFKVKCIPHTFSNQRKFQIIGNEKPDIHLAPSHVTIVVVPNIIKTKVELDRLHTPTASRGLLERISAFLKKRTTPFAKIQVLNPIYESIRTQFYVQFQKGKSPEFYRELLIKDINQFLAPWAFDPTATVTFGGVVYRSSILGFIENRDYVDYVVNFEMFQSSDSAVSKNEIKATSERVVLTTQIVHKILFVTDLPKENAALVPHGIGFDWKVSKNRPPQ